MQVLGGFGWFHVLVTMAILCLTSFIKLAVILKKENLNCKTLASINKGTACCLKSET